MTGRLQQQRGLADSRLATEQHQRTRDYAAAKYAIKLANAGGQPRCMSVLDLCVQLRIRSGTELRVSVLRPARRSAFGREGRALLDERIPRTAVRAPPRPLGRLRAALLTDEDRLRRLHSSRKASGIRP